MARNRATQDVSEVKTALQHALTGLVFGLLYVGAVWLGLWLFFPLPRVH